MCENNIDLLLLCVHSMNIFSLDTFIYNTNKEREREGEKICLNNINDSGTQHMRILIILALRLMPSVAHYNNLPPRSTS